MKKSNIVSLLNKLKSPVWILLIASFILRIILYTVLQPAYHLNEIIDSEDYQKLALQLLKEGNFIVPGSDLDTFRTPGYPLFIYFIYAIFGIKPQMVLFIQIFVNLASVYILYLIGKNLFNNKTGLIAALLLSLESDHLQYIYFVMSDSLFVFFLLLSFLTLIYFFKKQKILFLILSSFFAGTGCLVRPINTYFPVVLIFIIVVYSIVHGRNNLLKIVRYSLLIILVFGITISPWLIRNYVVYGYPELSSIQGYNMINYNMAYTVKSIEGRPIEEIREELNLMALKKCDPEKTTNPFYKSKIQSKFAVDYIKEHKFEYLKSHFRGMINLYLSMEYKNFAHRFFRIKDYTIYQKGNNYDKLIIDFSRFKQLPLPLIFIGAVYVIFLFFYYTTALLGCLRLFREKKYALLLSVLCIILYFTVITGTVGLARYKLPISPFYIIFSGYYLFTLFQNKGRESNKLSGEIS